MANSYIHIDQDCFKVMKLTPAEAVVYSLIAGYCKAGSGFVCKITDVCDRINVSERSVRYIINDLCERGYITKSRKQTSLELFVSEEWKTKGFENGKNCRTRTAKNADKNGKNCRTDRQNMPNTHYYNNNLNNPNNKGEIDEKYGILVECFTSTFKEAFGREYAPNFSSFSTAANNVCDNLVTAMKNDGYAYTPDTLRAYATQWFQLALRNSDDWHRERYSMEFVSSQFNYYNNQVNNNNNGHTTRQQTNDGISDEYIRQQFEKIARARAKRQSSADGGDCAAQRR